MYRVILKFKSYPFDSYSEALQFQQENGGLIYGRIYSEQYG